MDKGTQFGSMSDAASTRDEEGQGREPKRRRIEEEEEYFIISTERNRISDDSHYDDFGFGYSYEYITTTTSSVPILGIPLLPLSPTNSNRKCFNCDSSDHIFSACPFPRDASMIARNRAAHNEANTSLAGELTKLGNESERERSLTFVDRFAPGVVSDELRRAIGWGNDEFPWLGRIAQWGYPPGWIINEGARHPMEVAKDRIGRDLDFDNVELLQIFDDSTSPSPDSLAPSLPTTAPALLFDPFSPPSLPRDPPPPLPPGAPPPLPPGLPPFIPPPPVPTIRLVQYQTRQFDWETLPVYQSRYPFSLPRRSTYVPRSALDGAQGLAVRRSAEVRDVEGEKKAEVDEGLSEGEMDMSDEE